MKKEKGENDGQPPIVNDVKNTGNGEGTVWRNYNGGGCPYDLSESSSVGKIGETNSNENGYESEGCGKVDAVGGTKDEKSGENSKGETVGTNDSVETEAGSLGKQTSEGSNGNVNPSYTSRPSSPPQSNYGPNPQTQPSKPSYSVYEKEEIIDITNDISPLEEFIKESNMCDAARIALEKGVKGDFIYSMTDGIVIRNGFTGDSGSSRIEITFPNSNHTIVYQHGEFYDFKPGDVIKKGQVIGTMSDIGSEGAVHLHLEIRKNGIYTTNLSNAIDPTYFLSPSYKFAE